MEEYLQRELDAIGSAWTELLCQRLQGAPGRRILDAGAGSGFVSVVLARAGYQVTALDQSRTVCEELRALAGELGLTDRITVVTGEAERTLLPEAYYDGVVCQYASSLFRKPNLFYPEWLRILKPGGVILNYDVNWTAMDWDPKIAEEMAADRARLRPLDPDFRDIYDDPRALAWLRQLPLSSKKRPQWDRFALNAAGVTEAETAFLTGEALRTKRQNQWYRTLPIYEVRAVKKEA